MVARTRLNVTLYVHCLSGPAAQQAVENVQFDCSEMNKQPPALTHIKVYCRQGNNFTVIICL
jgi:hypothetical protein